MNFDDSLHLFQILEPMCDSYGDTEYPISANKIDVTKSSSCKKCHGENGAPVVLIRSDDGPMCRICFLTACTHKFRSTFGKSQLIRANELVLVGYSGGPSSTAMLKLIQEGLDPKAKKKHRFKPVYCHIDESILYGCNEQSDCLTQIETNLKSCSFPYHILEFSNLYENLLLSEASMPQHLPSLSNFKKLDLTGKEALLNIVRTRILITLAADFQCSRVLLADSCSRLAIKLLSGIAQGSGGQAAESVAFNDNRYGDISVVRPMREFSAKEITFLNHCHFNPISPVFMPNWETSTQTHSSIYRLTEDFVSGLQSSFPSTVFTVFRTACKLTNSSNTGLACRLCKCALSQRSSSAATAQGSLIESHKLVGRLPDKPDDLCLGCYQTLYPLNAIK